MRDTTTVSPGEWMTGCALALRRMVLRRIIYVNEVSALTRLPSREAKLAMRHLCEMFPGIEVDEDSLGPISWRLPVGSPLCHEVQPATRLTAEAVRRLANHGETAQVEFKQSIHPNHADRIRKNICALANDLPGTNQPGYVLIGVAPDGAIVGTEVSEKLLNLFTHMRHDGGLAPSPVMQVYTVKVDDLTVLVIEVSPCLQAPVRFSGITWVRVGPSVTVATQEEERLLRERRAKWQRTFDQQRCPGAALDDLDLEAVTKYLRIEEQPNITQLEARQLWIRQPQGEGPTNAAVLVFSRGGVSRLFPALAFHYVRYSGTRRRENRIVESRVFRGGIAEQLRILDCVRRICAGGGYPEDAIEVLVMNAMIHRDYEGDSPSKLLWLKDRVEIVNCGGLSEVDAAKVFAGEPLVHHRNDLIADLMQRAGLCRKLGSGLQFAREALEDHGNRIVFKIDRTQFKVVIYVRDEEIRGIPKDVSN